MPEFEKPMYKGHTGTRNIGDHQRMTTLFSMEKMELIHILYSTTEQRGTSYMQKVIATIENA
jgi:hypothetical protein